jgi:pheromone a factor receptor
MIPSVAAVLALSIIGAILQVPLIIFYFRTRNIPVVFLAGWYFIICTISILSIAIWGNDNIEDWWNGEVFCDIVIRLQVGYNCGVLCATCAIARNLSKILANDKPQLNNNSFSSRIADVAICGIMPLLLLALVYIVQVRRYLVYQYQGWTLALTSWVRIPLILIWPTVWALIASGYVILTLHRFRLKSKDMGDLLHTTGSNMTRIQIVRFVSCCAIIVLTILPLSIYTLIVDIQSQLVEKFSWNGIHDPLLWGIIIKLRSNGPSLSQYFDIPLSVITFICFGTSREVNAWYGQLADGIHRTYQQLIKWISDLWKAKSTKSLQSLSVKFGGPARSLRSTPAYGPRTLRDPNHYLNEEELSEMDWQEMMELGNVKLAMPRSPDSSMIGKPELIH